MQPPRNQNDRDTACFDPDAVRRQLVDQCGEAQRGKQRETATFNSQPDLSPASLALHALGQWNPSVARQGTASYGPV